MRLFATILTFMFASPITAMEILIEDSTLGFEISVGERQVRGTFHDWSADIDFDRREISVVVQMASTTTGDPLLDAVMHGAGWLNSSVNSEAEFLSDNIVTSLGGLHVATGTLSIAGTLVPLTVSIQEPRPFTPILYSAHATINRKIAGMVGFEGTVDDTVVIFGQIALVP